MYNKVYFNKIASLLEAMAKCKDCDCEDEKESDDDDEKEYGKKMSKKKMKEDVEQINELRPSTLANYGTKASKQAADYAAQSVWSSVKAKDKDAKTNVEKAKKRIKGVSLAFKKLSKVKSEQWGDGEVIPGTEIVMESEDGQQFITHVDAIFSHGIEFNIPLTDVTVVESADREKHYKKASKAEKLMDKESEGSKKFAKMHDHGQAELVYDDEDGHKDASKAGRVTKHSPPRRGDQR